MASHDIAPDILPMLKSLKGCVKQIMQPKYAEHRLLFRSPIRVPCELVN
jgi:hypothetical protein